MKLRRHGSHFTAMVLNKTCSFLAERKGLNQKCLLAAFVFVIFIFISNAAMAATYYVNPVSGSDTASGAKTSPWKTIAKAKTTVVAGDIVNLLPGSYGSVTFGQTGDKYGSSWVSPITYQNDPQSAPYSAQFSQIYFTGAHNFYIIVSGFDVLNTGSADSCIKTENASYVRILDCKAHGNSSGTGPTYANIFVKSSTNILIEDCEVYYTQNEGIELEDSDTCTARFCHVHDISGSAMRTGGGQNYLMEYSVVHDQRVEWNPTVHGSGFSMHSNNTTLRGNIVYNFGNTRPMRFYGAVAGAGGYRNILVEDNLVYKTTDFTGVQWWTDFIDMGGGNCIIRNNTFTGGVLIELPQNGVPAGGLSIYNNIITDYLEINDYGSVATGSGRTQWNNIREGNNIFALLRAKGCGYQCNYTSFSGTSNSLVGGSFTVGTMFNSGPARYPYTAQYPYQLCSGSRAINFGNAANAAPVDLLERARVGLPDAGCYEYGSSQTFNQPPVANAGPDQTVTDTDNNGSQQVTLNASASTDPDGSIASYIWTKNGSQIATGATPSVTLPTGINTILLTVTDNGGATSTDTVVVTIQAIDTTPPQLLSVNVLGQTSLKLTFNEALLQSSAQTVANYRIDNGITVSAAVLAADAKTVTLTVSAQINLQTYNLTVSNVKDLAGNSIAQKTVSYVYSSPDLVGFWKFDENTGTVANDSSGKANNGTLINGPTWTGSGSILFNGSNQYVNCGSQSTLNLTGSFTISACINPTSFGQSNYGRIVDKGTASTGFSLFVQGSNNSIGYVVYGGNIVSSNAQVVQLNTWQQIAVAFDNTAKTVTFYLNGQNVGTSSYTTAPSDSSVSPLLIGIRGYDLTRAFSGQIDNVRTYNRALNATEVLGLFQSDFPEAFYPIGDKQVDEGSALTFSVNPYSPNINIQLASHNLPSQPTFVNNVFTWTPAAGTAGTYQVTFTAQNGSIEDSETIDITVNIPNRAPIFAPIPNKNATVGQQISFNVSATDPDGDAITYTAQSLPTGASFNNGVFSWTPQQTQVGQFQITFTASDSLLSASQSTTITVSAPTPPPPTITGLVAQWNFDEGSGLTTADFSANANTGTLVNGPVWTYGYAANAIDFNGTNNYVNCGTKTCLNLTSSLTIAAWIKPYSFGQGNYGRIVDKGTKSTGFSFFVSGSNKSIGYVIYGGKLITSNANTIALNLWQHVAAVYDQNARIVTFYVNGTPAGSTAYTTPPLAAQTSPMLIGIMGYNLTRAFDGLIDNVRIYNRALTATELAQICQPASQSQAQEIIIDNTDTASTSHTGTWTASGATGFYGSDSVWSRDGATWTWIFTPQISRQYTLSMWWTQYTSRSSSIPVTIQNANGSTTVYINQLANGSMWNNLGTYSFNAGQSYNITITSQPDPTSTCADAIKLTPIQ